MLASLRGKLRGACDAFSAILVHACGSCDICGLLSVCGGTGDDSESDWRRFFFFFSASCLIKEERKLSGALSSSPSLIFSSSSVFSAPFLILESFPSSSLSLSSSSSLPCSF